MKASLKCPKCRESRIWIINPFRIPSETANGQELPVVPHQAAASFLGLGRVTPRGSFELFACAGCGYSELYALDLSALEEDPKRGIRLVDASAQTQGPFR